VAQIVYELLTAGHETTTGLIGNALRQLLTHRHAREEICGAPSLIPNAVEEVLRFDSSVIAWRRQTTEAVAIGGVPVPAGANLLLLGSANRDPAVFEDPDHRRTSLADVIPGRRPLDPDRAVDSRSASRRRSREPIIPPS
jgi:cytochrome P450